MNFYFFKYKPKMNTTCFVCCKITHKTEDCQFKQIYQNKRIIWYGYKRENDNLFKLLPREIVLLIFSYCYPLFHDLFEILRKFEKPPQFMRYDQYYYVSCNMALSIPSTYKFDKYYKHFEKLKCFIGRLGNPFLIKGNPKLNFHEKNIILSYGLFYSYNMVGISA